MNHQQYKFTEKSNRPANKPLGLIKLSVVANTMILAKAKKIKI